ncbi:hypothetical protein LTR66_007230 [Elasticomyces elasticus]|nr:hypothetical protein LTR66_007230 [Elasticomyces elasticus]KAK4989790.1 hypothetical protein LTR50_002964 [Elasticomyces elasticus]
MAEKMSEMAAKTREMAAKTIEMAAKTDEFASKALKIIEELNDGDKKPKDGLEDRPAKRRYKRMRDPILPKFSWGDWDEDMIVEASDEEGKVA